MWEISEYFSNSNYQIVHFMSTDTYKYTNEYLQEDTQFSRAIT